MELSIKRVYDPPAASDGFRVLVDRLWPRGLAKAKAKVDWWAKELAPSAELRRWFHHGDGTWGEFRRRYLAELHANPEAVRAFHAAVAGHPTVTLLYGAKDREHNQAVVLRGILEKSGAVAE